MGIHHFHHALLKTSLACGILVSCFTPLQVSASAISVAVDLDQHLATSHATISSARFLLLYPKEVAFEHASDMLDVLESEYRRLSVWIPPKPGGMQRLEVLLFHADDFARAYGPAIVGIYDGKIRIPLDRWAERNGIFTSTITHELVHALVTESSRNGAPHWLHEGLAQYLEIDHQFPDPATLARFEPLSLLWIDEVIGHSVDTEMIDQAYRESAWVVHFIGNRYGIVGIRQLIQGFAEKIDTEVVLQQALNISTAEFELAFQDWAGREALIAYRRSREPGAYEDSLLDQHAASRQQTARHLQRMDDWYQHYAWKIRPLKQSLREVVEALRLDPAAPPIDSCQRMNRDLSAVMSDTRFRQCPHADVQDTLLEAFHSFEDLAVACKLGRTDLMQVQLQAAEQSLQVSASLLEPYGLEP